jgi:hypothetical protein
VYQEKDEGCRNRSILVEVGSDDVTPEGVEVQI